jgi:hypothetical protein
VVVGHVTCQYRKETHVRDTAASFLLKRGLNVSCPSQNIVFWLAVVRALHRQRTKMKATRNNFGSKKNQEIHRARRASFQAQNNTPRRKKTIKKQ